MKKCTKCHIEKPATTEFFCKKSKAIDGLNWVCKQCGSADTKAYREKNPEAMNSWRAKNADRIKAWKVEYRALNAEKIASYQKSWLEKNPGYHKAWDDKNRDKRRATTNRYSNRRLVEDAGFRLYKNMSRSIRHHLKGGKRGAAWEQLVGYTTSELAAHLEKQFLRGMTWENQGEWHIDHIVPASSFVVSDAGDKEFMACWALSNLRPMWGKENISKGARRTYMV